MNNTTIFHLISDISKKSGVSCVLIGGFAVNYYKVTRQTADVDFLTTKEDFEKISSYLKKFGYKEDFSQDVFARFVSTGRLYLFDVDFMFVDKDTFDKIIKSGKKAQVAGQQFIVPSLENLIALKLHSLKHNPKLRETKDLPDIVDLIRVNKIDIKARKFKDLCLKYGTKDIYDTLSERI